MQFKEGRIIRTLKLKGRTVIFRYPKATDAADMRTVMNSLISDKACLSLQKKITMSEEEKFLDKTISQMKKRECILLCAEVDGKYAGNCRVSRKERGAMKHVATIGIAIGKDFQNMGIGTELLKSIEDLARREMKIHVLEISHFELNERARHVYEKVGFKEVGRIPKGINHYGKYMDHVLMAKTLKPR